MKYLSKFVARLREPSTMAGLSVLAVLFGVKPEEVDAVTGVVGAVLAAGAVLLPEKVKAE